MLIVASIALKWGSGTFLILPSSSHQSQNRGVGIVRHIQFFRLYSYFEITQETILL